MELTRIERYVDDLLTVSGVEKEGKERTIGLALYHLLMSAALRDLMSDDEKELLKALTKKVQYFFCTRLSLKERKRKTEKKSIPPNPLLKEKEKKEKVEKKRESVDDAKLAFHEECLKYIGLFDNQRLTDFYLYWSEEDSKGKMRFQYERCWNTEKRLKRWMTTSYNIANTAAAVRLSKLKKQQAKEQTDTEKQRLQAAEREQANAQREAEQEKSREGQMTTAEYIKANPDSLMARIYREKNKKT